jgi:hypothetical protein
MKNIHVLPTDKPSRLHTYKGVLNLAADEFVAPTIVKNDLINLNIYITSDEIIKDVRPHEDKWQLEQEQILNKFPTYLTDLSECKLVIMTTDIDLIKNGVQAIDDKFLEWFVKNPSCEFVEVADLWKDGNPSTHDSYQIIIPQIEPKQETTLEKAAEIYANKKGDIPTTKLEDAIFKQGFIDGAKWQQEQQDNFVIGFLEYIEGTYSYSNIYDHWYLHSDTSKTYSKKELLKVYLKSKYYNETYKKDK